MCAMLDISYKNVKHIERAIENNVWMTLEEAINELFADETAKRGKKVSNAELARFVGCSRATITDWRNGNTKEIEGRNAHQVAKFFNVSAEWVQTRKGSKYPITNPADEQRLQAVKQGISSNATYLGGFDVWDESTPLNDDEVALPFFREVELAAGAGRAHHVIENHGNKLRFAKSTLKKQGVQTASAYCVTVSGNSMEPVLPDGSTVGIDTSDVAIKNGKMYAIDHDGQLRVKLLYQMPGGVLRLRSYNQDEWPDELCSGDDLAKIRILGRVFWSSALW